MFFDLLLYISRSLLITTGTQVNIRHAERIPSTAAMLVTSNHRSFLDLSLVMNVVNSLGNRTQVGQRFFEAYTRRSTELLVINNVIHFSK